MLKVEFGKNKKCPPPKKELEERYAALGATITSLARECDVVDVTMKKWLLQAGITIKSKQQTKREASQLKSKIEFEFKQKGR